MIRIIGFHVLIFALPFIVYGLYATVFRKVRDGEELFEKTPVYHLAVVGLVLSIIGFFLTASFTGSSPGGVYTPAQMRDGQLVPGHIENPDGGNGG
ncbi:MAG: DUF6111 family protein [Alphaproteobacteria bacterium]